MEKVVEWLNRDFVIVDLGAASATDQRLLKPYFPSITLVELDAVNDSQVKSRNYFRHVFAKGGIAGRAGPRVFTRRAFPNASSILRPREELVRDYDLEKIYEALDEVTLECRTLSDTLSGLNIQHIDFLKTDLEGMDYEVLFSSAELLKNTLVVQSELRFQPFYEEEPTFFKVGSFLEQLEFELLGMKPEAWKYRTPRRSMARDGRWVFADAIFFRSPASVSAHFGQESDKAFAKQIILACSLGYPNYAEFLLEKIKGTVSAKLVEELSQTIRRSLPRVPLLICLCNCLCRIRGGARVLNALRRAGTRLSRSATVFSFFNHVASP